MSHTLNRIKLNLRFIALLTRLRLSHMMAFRLGFFEAFFADGVLFAMQLAVFQAIYGQVDMIGDWTRGRMLIFIGTFSMINALNMTIYFFGVLRIPHLIREGGLDHYLAKPGSALLRLTFERVDPGSAPLILLSAAIVGWGVSVDGLAVTIPLALGYAALTALMTLLYYDMEVILRTLPFFFISTAAVDRLEGELLTLNFKIPGVFYKGALKFVFYFVLPYGIMATAPAQLLSGALGGAGLAQAVCAAVAFTAFTIWFWRLGLRHYKSASS